MEKLSIAHQIDYCNKFLADPTRNPHTGRKITKGGPTYTTYMEMCQKLLGNPVIKETPPQPPIITPIVVPSLQSEVLGVVVPAPQVISITDMLIQADSPRLPYYQGSGQEKNTVHWGQRKLLISEIQFLTLFHESVSDPLVLYPGVAPLHVKILHKLFPAFTFHLYDTNPLVKELADNKSIFWYPQLFTDEIAASYSGKSNVYLICDIRTADWKVMTGEGVEEAVSQDMQLQNKWFSIIKPVAASMKFRLPYPDKWPSPTYSYPFGYIFKQPWAPPNSTECRIVPVLDSNGNLQVVDWNIKEYEEQMFYHNTIVRDHQKFLSEVLPLDTPGLDPPDLIIDFDSMAEVLILKDYILKTYNGKSLDLVTEIKKLSGDITEELNRGKPLTKWVTFDKIRSKINDKKKY